MKIKIGDTVRVIVGKDNGREGKVVRIYRKMGKVLVENINMFKKHMQKSEQYPQGGIVDVPRPLSISNVMLVCPKCKKPTRVGYVREDGKRSRLCKVCKKQFS
ncbi:50S ribosomal protein L24 [Candidatus Woesebacteria bacterium]|nr:50S ribosomal protein L24 [Candidatus Woesebacteria bacterium]